MTERKLTAILHADVVGSTALVQLNETLAHERIRDTFQRFSEAISSYGGIAHEIRGDALLAGFTRASDAVGASLAFQAANAAHNDSLVDDVRPVVRVGIAIGEVVIGDNTVTGEGVVLAQRLEQLAEPGGVCIQSAAYETIPKRLPFNYENLGERQLKGFADPVKVYVVGLRPGAALPKPETRTGSEAATSNLPDKPSIAVLPFVNMSGDLEQEYFSDGVTEDIITDLSKLSNLFVIARNSSFTYKGKMVKVQEVAHDLSVRYVLQGSVRKAGNRIRLTAQLVDGSSGQHLWAERYDRDLGDIFGLQDELSQKVVTATAVQLSEGDQQRFTHRSTENVEAYDSLLRGREQLLRHTPESNAQAVSLFEKAIECDPDYGIAYGHLAEAHLQQLQLGWVDSAEATLQRALENAKRSVALDNKLGLAHGVLGQIYLWQKRHDEAVVEGEKRVALDPGDAEGIATLAMTHAFSGAPDRALELIKTAMRLDPHYPFWHLHVIALAQMTLENYTEAIAALKRAILRNPDSMPLHMVLAACLALVGEQEAAKQALAESKRLHPSLSMSFAAEQVPYQHPEDRERLVAGLHKAGLEE